MHIYKQENLFYRSENRHVRVFEDDEFQCCISDLCREMRGENQAFAIDQDHRKRRRRNGKTDVISWEGNGASHILDKTLNICLDFSTILNSLGEKFMPYFLPRCKQNTK